MAPICFTTYAMRFKSSVHQVDGRVAAGTRKKFYMAQT